MTKDKNVISVDCVKDIQIVYTDAELKDISKKLADKKSKITALKDEKASATSEFNREIKELEKELESDIDTLKCGYREIPKAQCKAELDKTKKTVSMVYQDKVVSTIKFDPEAHKSIFGEITSESMKE